MDLRTHLSVIWRWRVVVGVGIALAVVLAFFSVARVSFAHGATVSYRQGQTWQGSETLLINQPGGLYVQAAPGPSSNPGWLASLTGLYAQIANSAAIRSRVFRGGLATKATGDYTASQVMDQSNQPLAVLRFDGTGGSPAEAVSNAHRASLKFRGYVVAQAAGSNVTAGRRVVVNVLTAASISTAKVVKGRKLTVPILVFLAVLIGALGLAYVLENLRPRKRAAAAPASEQPSARTSARPRRERQLEPVSESVETTTRRK